MGEQTRDLGIDARPADGAGRLRPRHLIGILVTVAMVMVLLPMVVRAAEPDPVTNSLSFTTQPAGGTGGEAFATQPVVEVRDASDDPVTTPVTVVLTIAPGTGDPGATLTCDAETTVDGVATFDGCAIDLAASGYVLRASAEGAADEDSASFDVVPGAPSAVEFVVQPHDITAGESFSSPVAFRLVDAGGNPLVATDHALGLIAVDPDGAPIPLTGCTGGETIDDQGAEFYSVPDGGDSTVPFPDCSVGRAGSGYTLLAVAVPSDPSETSLIGYSDEFDVTTGAPERLVFTTQPGGAVAGEPLQRQPRVTLQDGRGNTVPVDEDPAIQLTVDQAGVSLDCPDGNRARLEAGVATFENCTLRSDAFWPGGNAPLPTQDFTLTARHLSSGLEVVSAPFGSGATSGQAATLEFEQQPPDGTGGVPLDPQPSLTVVGEGGGPAEVEVGLELLDGAPDVVVECTNPTALPREGVATFHGCAVDAPGTYRLKAVAGEQEALSDPFTIAVGPAVAVRLDTVPTAAVAGEPFAIAASLRDAGQNQVLTSGADVRVALAAGDGGRTADLSCDGGTATTTVVGLAEFTSCSVDRPGDYRVVAMSPVGVTVSEPFPVTVGPPATLTFVSTPASAVDGGLLATPMVLVEDAGGNAIDATVGLTIGGGSLGDCDLSVVSRRGIAAFPGCTLQTSASEIVLRASAGAVQTDATVPVVGGAPVGDTDVAIALAQTFGGNAHATNPTFVTNDVNAATGALQFTIHDLTVAGIGQPLELRRTYNSWDTEGGVFGPGWSSIFDAGVSFDDDGNALVRAEDGQRLLFTQPACGKKKCKGFEAPAGALVDLTCKGTECTVVRRDGISFTSVDGRIQSYRSPAGHGLEFEWDRAGELQQVALTTSGAPLTVDVTMADGKVAAVTSPTQSLSYAYAGDHLVASTDPDGNTTAYDHDADGRLRRRTLGAQVLDVTYRPDGRVDTAALRGQARRFDDRYVYSDAPGDGVSRTTRITVLEVDGAEGTGEYVEYHRGNVVVREQHPEGETLAYSWDADARWVGFQDGLGHVQRMAYDGAGNLVRIQAPDGGVSSFAHDDRHRVIAATDQFGNTYEYNYAGDDLRWIVPPEPDGATGEPGAPGQVGTHFTHDEWGQLIEITTAVSVKTIRRDEAGNEIGHQYFAPHDTERLQPLNGNGPRLVHDEAGNLIESTSARGHGAGGAVDAAFRTTYDYDGNGRITRIDPPDAPATTLSYTPGGELQSLTRPLTGTSTYTWDEISRTRTVSGADTGVWAFDAAGNLVEQIDEDDRRTRSRYDRSGRTVAVIDPTGFESRQIHDAASNVVRVVDAHGTQWIRHGYHGPVRITDETGDRTIGYDLAGNVSAAVDAAGLHSTYTYDRHGNLASVGTAAGVTSYGYDAFRNLTSITDGRGDVTTLVNDPTGQLASRTIEGSTWTYDHDVDGNLRSTTDPDGRTTTYTLDPSGRRTEIVHTQPGSPTIRIEQGFDDLGRRVAMTDPTGAHSYTYDEDDRLIQVTSPQGTFSYDHSTPGERTDTHPDGTVVTYRYADGGKLMGLEADGVSVAYTRSPSGRLAGVATGNGLFESFGYDEAGRLSSQSIRCGTDFVHSSQYGYDDRSRPLGIQRIAGGQTDSLRYGYDDANRLVADEETTAGTRALPTAGCLDGTPPPATTPPAEPTPSLPAPAALLDPAPVPSLTDLEPATGNAVGYDPTGNRTSYDGTTYTYGGMGELLSGSDGRTATHDASGNLTTSTVNGETTTYGYDAAGRLVSVGLPDGRTVTYTLDGDGLRVGKDVDGTRVATYHWDTRPTVPLLVKEDLGGAGFRRYFHGTGPVAMQTADATSYLHTDGLTNVTAMSDDDGALLATYTYDAWGGDTVHEAPGAPSNLLRYGGHLLDPDTGLLHMRAREYDPTLGRFTQRDPVTPAIGVPVLSSYAYAANLPTVFGDATGQYAEKLRTLGQSSPEATTVAATRGGVAGGRFLGTKVLPKALMTQTAFRGASRIVGGAGGRGALGATAAIDDTVKLAAKAGKFLAVVGIGLSIASVALECTYGGPYQCASATIGLAFNVGCLMVSGGALTMLCTAMGLGLSFITSTYGPDIVRGTTDAALTVGRAIGADRVSSSPVSVSGVIGVTIAVAIAGVCVVATAGLLTPLCLAGAAALGTYLWAFGSEIDAAISSGFNQLADLVTTGLDSALDLLFDAGLGLELLGGMMLDGLSWSADQMVSYFTAQGLAVADFFGPMIDQWAMSAEQAVLLFRDLGTELEDIVAGLEAAFGDATDWGEQAVADALAYARYSYDEILHGLDTAFAISTQTVFQIGMQINADLQVMVATIEETLGAAADEILALGLDAQLTLFHITDSLRHGYDLAVAEVVQLLADAQVGVEQLAATLGKVYDDVVGWGEEALAAALADAGYLGTEILRGLQSAFDTTAELGAAILYGLSFGADAIVSALSEAYGASADAVAEILVDLGASVSEIADALGEVFGLASDAIADVLGDAGAALDELGEFFGDLGDDIADTLNPVNWF